MATNIIKGRNLMLFTNVGTDEAPNYMSIAFATTHTFSMSAETTDISSKDHGVYGAQEVSKLTWEVTSENLMSNAVENGYQTLYDFMVNQTVIPVMFSLTNSAATDTIVGNDPQTWSIGTEIINKPNFDPHTEMGKYSIVGEAIITSLTLNANNGETATFSVTLNGTSSMSFVEAPSGFNINFLVNADSQKIYTAYNDPTRYETSCNTLIPSNSNYYFSTIFNAVNKPDYGQTYLYSSSQNTSMWLTRRGPDPTTASDWGQWGNCYTYYFSKQDWSMVDWNEFQDKNYDYVCIQQTLGETNIDRGGTPQPVQGIMYAYNQNLPEQVNGAWDTTYVQNVVSGNQIKIPFTLNQNTTGQRYVVYLSKVNGKWRYDCYYQLFFSPKNTRFYTHS